MSDTETDTGLPEVFHWVDGKQRAGSGERQGSVYDPAAGAATKRVRFATETEVDDAVASARAAFATWRHSTIAQRTKILFRFYQLCSERIDDLAAIITSEHGKTLTDARSEVERGLEVVEVACGIGSLMRGAFTEQASTRIDVYSIRQPLGPVAIISPFNFPAMVPCWFFPIAIACGNTVVLKPSEKVPSTAIWLAERWSEAGLPAGVFNVVHGDKVVVDRLLEHPDLRAVSFVGSTPVARYVYETATRHGKRVQALGGAKNHMVVLPDADVAQVVNAAVSAGFGSAGERCMAVSVLVAIDPIGDAVVASLAERMAELRTGDGRSDSDMGPLVTEQHRARVASYVEAGVQAGAELVVDGRDVAVEEPRDGYWLGPTLFDRVRPEMTIYTDEIFGPVLSVVRAPDYDSALALVNASPYGNGAAIFTSDGRAARRFQNEVEAGMVGINVPIPVPVAYYSFGGWKNSLFGDLHAHGTEGVQFYTRGKVVTARWPDASPTGVEMSFPSTAGSMSEGAPS